MIARRALNYVLSSNHGWLGVSALITALMLAPLASLIFIGMQDSAGLWPHLLAYVLPQALSQTALLLIGVGLVVIVVGLGAAWLVTAYDFPGRGWLEWALLLPLAVPTYVIAFAYLDILHPLGPVQGALRFFFGIENPRDFSLPDIRSLTGCILLLGSVLYPYVYISARAMFLLQPASLIEAAQTLGARRMLIFRKVALPLARPGIAVGVSLALMETLNDIGAAEFLGVRTITVSIYSTWINRGNLPGAVQIALIMLFFVFALVLLERWGRRHADKSVADETIRTMPPQIMHGWRGWALLGLGSLPVIAGFVLPAIYLLSTAMQRLQFSGFPLGILREAANSFGVAFIATLIALLLGFFIAYTTRLAPGRTSNAMLRVSGLGYAIPGTVLGIGLLGPLTGIDLWVDNVSRHIFNLSTGLLVTGGGFALIFAYVARFLVIASGGAESGLAKISTAVDETADTLGADRTARLMLVHLPLMGPVLASAALLIFVDCMKELPATLLLRPPGFETLATHLYAEAARGTYEDGAIAALLIVLVGLLPIIALARVGRKLTETPEQLAWGTMPG
jgi:iron(III) transport system permease protein